jgi:predicted dehydrogenase
MPHTRLQFPRRTFLGWTACTAALGASSAADPIRIGFLGAVHSHAEDKLKVVAKSAAWRLAGVCESDPAVAGRLRAAGTPMMSRSALLSDPSIPVIAVESAVRDHAADAMAVLEAGKHLHLEKAPASDLASVRRIASEAVRRNLLLQVGHMWRYHPGLNKAIEIVRSGALGQVYMIRASISNQLALARRAEWGQFSGGVMFELGGHLIDPIVRMMGRPRRITPFLRTDGVKDSLRDNTAVIIEWDQAMASLHASTMQPNSSRHRSVEIYGSKGFLSVQPIEPPKLFLELSAASGGYSAGQQQIALPLYERYVDDFANLAAAVRGQEKLPVSPDDEILIQEVILKCSGMA